MSSHSTPHHSCQCCNNEQLHTLARLPRTIISDGQIWDQPLERVLCDNCGAVQHKVLLTEDDQNKIYGASYSLGAGISNEDLARAKKYRDWILSVFAHLGMTAPKTALEVGCGSGALAREFQDLWPEANILTVEPSKQAAQQAQSLGLEVINDSFENLDGAITQRQDLIYSVNVMEHALEPIKFLETQRQFLSRDGAIVCVVPNGDVPNIEILFYDHVVSFTYDSFTELAKHVGLQVCYYEAAPESIGCFQIFVLSNNNTYLRSTKAGGEQTRDAKALKHAYLSAWQTLDDTLCAKFADASKKIAVFGAGEMTAIIRAHAPKFWEKVTCLTVDVPANSTFYEKDVVSLSEIIPEDYVVFIATRPDYGDLITTKLKTLGFTTSGIHEHFDA